MDSDQSSSWWYLDDHQLESILTGLLEVDYWWIGVMTALVAGVVHGLGPGHGKTLIGAYLSSGRGSLRDAFLLGASVAVMHTVSVLVVAVASYGATGLPFSTPAEQVLRVVSSGAVIVVGVCGLRREARKARGRHRQVVRPVRGATQAYSGVGAEHHPVSARSVGEGTRHGHSHPVTEDVAPLSRAGIVALATASGLLPSPGAFLLLMTAIALGRVGYGVGLVVAFGLGLATTIAGVGVLVIRGREQFLGRRRSPGTLTTVMPVIGNSVVVAGGVGLALVAVTGS